MLMSREAMIHRFMHAAVLASKSQARPPRCARKGRRVKGFKVHEASKHQAQYDGTFHSAFLVLQKLPCVHIVEVMMFDALAMSCILKHMLSKHVLSSV
eukprot:9294081-Pyramimonas_sp.AAC.1